MAGTQDVDRPIIQVKSVSSRIEIYNLLSLRFSQNENYQLYNNMSKVPKTLSKAAPQLGRLSTILTCSICYEALVRPVATPCGHTFCSLCIRFVCCMNQLKSEDILCFRKFLQFQQRCPSCLLDTREPQLRPDRWG